MDDRCGPTHGEVDSPLAFEPVDQQVDGRGAKRVPTDEQRLEGEDLPERVIFDVVRYESIEALVRAQSNQIRNDSHHIPEA